MKKNKAIKCRIYPNSEQETLLSKTFGCVRKVFNELLAHQINLYEKGEKRLSKYDLFKYMTNNIKPQYTYLKEVDSLSLMNSAFNLDTAYGNFFSKRSEYPKFKSKRNGKKSYTTNMVGNNIQITDDTHIKLPKLGLVKCKVHRTVPEDWKLKSATVSQSSSGKYYVSVLYEYETDITPVDVNGNNVIGLDYKSNGLYMNNEGYSPDTPKNTKKYAKKLAHEQKKLAKMVGSRKGEKPSSNFIKQKHKVNRVHEKIANGRKDFLHKESTRIANLYDAVCIEDLNMTDIAHAHEYRNYRKATYDNGFGMFREMLSYKLEDRGKRLVIINKAFPSSKLCSCCGHLVDELPDNIRKWECPKCHTKHDRDINSAINIRVEGLFSLI